MKLNRKTWRKRNVRAAIDNVKGYSFPYRLKVRLLESIRASIAPQIETLRSAQDKLDRLSKGSLYFERADAMQSRGTILDREYSLGATETPVAYAQESNARLAITAETESAPPIPALWAPNMLSPRTSLALSKG